MIGQHCLAPQRKVPVAYAPAVVTQVSGLKAVVSMHHPQRQNLIYQEFLIDELIFIANSN